MKNKLPVPLNDEYCFLKLFTCKEEGQGMTNSNNITPVQSYTLSIVILTSIKANS